MIFDKDWPKEVIALAKFRMDRSGPGAWDQAVEWATNPPDPLRPRPVGTDTTAHRISSQPGFNGAKSVCEGMLKDAQTHLLDVAASMGGIDLPEDASDWAKTNLSPAAF